MSNYPECVITFISQYEPKHQTWPYTTEDFRRADETPDSRFYTTSRIDVNHIDDLAIDRLSRYYAMTLPHHGVILDLCTSWTSHFPTEILNAVEQRELVVHGVGMNDAEMAHNPSLNAGWSVCDLNITPDFPTLQTPYDAAMCVVSVDYLTRPTEVLTHLRGHMHPGAMVHIVVSERCFPTKAVKLWLRLNPDERLQTVGDFLHFSGYTNIEIVHLSPASGFSMMYDTIWVVRGRAPESSQ
ncbi:hypothetical protein P154DRAFT_423242 [Amniculicola lignicola CBS 123094]|uniref:Methyltransferase type 11 domain-containing protein n=1 Tax=Amniculicola lignicola CBS 123094 TaxID=1392246 RepID=A0A6A5WWA3_9PLEO|nr:hypothetical protein P154DRAFT_423242 [Amniculicola lignicola CBS 123094]